MKIVKTLECLSHAWLSVGFGITLEEGIKWGFQVKVFGKERIADTTKRKLFSKENSHFQGKLLFFMEYLHPC